MPLHPCVLIAEPIDPAPLEWIRDRTRIEEAAPGSERFEAAAAEAEGLIVRTYTRVDEGLLDALPRLRVVGRAGVGLENIAVEACRARGIEVVHTPEANTQAVVEYLLCLLADGLRPRVVLDEAVSTDRWHAIRREICGERQMNERTLGVLGLGRIGRRVAEVAVAIGFTVRHHDLRELPPVAGAAATDLETLVAESDVLTLHVDGRPSNRHLVDAKLLSRAKPELLLINTSRGLVVDHEALAARLEAHPGSMAILDVHDPEPFAADHPLLGLANAHLLPHLASRTRTATENMSWVVRDVVEVLEGRPPRWPAPAGVSDGASPA